MWLSEKRVPVNALDEYFGIFLPPPLLKGRERINSYQNTAGKLLIRVLKSGLDIIGVLKHRHGLINYALTFQSYSHVSSKLVKDLEQISNNKHPRYQSVSHRAMPYLEFATHRCQETARPVVDEGGTKSESRRASRIS